VFDGAHRFGDVARRLTFAWLQLLARCWMSALIKTLRRKLSGEFCVGIGDGIVFLLWFRLGSRRFGPLYGSKTWTNALLPSPPRKV